MRVIAGRFGGRRLQAPRGSITRPTSGRVREALFSMLGDPPGNTVLDLFAGTGALGIEALSRGAEQAVFVERNTVVLAVLSANLAQLRLGETHAQTRRADALAAMRTARTRHETYDLVFIDPPYRRARDLGAELPALLTPLLEPGARVVVESDRRAPLQLPLEVEQQRIYGDTAISIYRHNP